MTGRLRITERAARGLCGEHVTEPVLAGRWGKVRIRPGRPVWPLSSEGHLWCPESVGLSRVGLAGLFLAGSGISACVRLPCVTRLPGRGACLLRSLEREHGVPRPQGRMCPEGALLLLGSI